MQEIEGASVEVAAQDVVKCVVQFCLENGFTRAAQALEDEAGVTVRAVPSREALARDIEEGRWDKVMRALGGRDAAPVQDLYAHAALELACQGEGEVARSLLHGTAPGQALKAGDAARFAKLEGQLGRRPRPEDAFAGGEGGMRQARKRLAREAAPHGEVVPAGRLLALAQDAVRWRRRVGEAPLVEEGPYDVWRGAAPAARDDRDEACVGRKTGEAKTGKRALPTCVAFTEDGGSVCVASDDGIVELLHPGTGTLRNDLPFQASGALIAHADSPVLALASSPDGALLATGDAAGTVRVWRLDTGGCVRSFDAVHSGPIGALAFGGAGGSELLSAGGDGAVRVLGLRSGRALRVMRGTEGAVTGLAWAGPALAVSCGTDGLVRVWDVKGGVQVRSVEPDPAAAQRVGGGQPLLALAPVPGRPNVFLTCDGTWSVWAVHAGTGTRLGRLTADAEQRADDVKAGGHGFHAVTASPRGAFLYALTDAGRLHCWRAGSAARAGVDGAAWAASVKAHKQEGLSLAHHPHRNCLATAAKERSVKMWAPA